MAACEEHAPEAVADRKPSDNDLPDRLRDVGRFLASEGHTNAIYCIRASDEIEALRAALQYGFDLYGDEGPDGSWPIKKRRTFDWMAKSALGLPTTGEHPLSPPDRPDAWSPDNDPHHLAESCEDPRLTASGYKVCGSGANTQWHWQEPNGRWHDGHRSELAAARAALRHLRASASEPA